MAYPTYPLTIAERHAVRALQRELQTLNQEFVGLIGEIALRLGVPPQAFSTTHEIDAEAGLVRLRPFSPSTEHPTEPPTE